MEQIQEQEVSLAYFKAEELRETVDKLVARFGGDELEVAGEIDILSGDGWSKNRLDILWFNPKGKLPNWMAKISKMPEWLIALGIKPLVLMCVKPIFDELKLKPAVARAIIFHELSHISFDEKGNYRLIDHDVKDFESLISRIGIKYEKASEMFGDIEVKPTNTTN